MITNTGMMDVGKQTDALCRHTGMSTMHEY